MPRPAELSALRSALAPPPAASKEERASLRKQVFADFFWALLSGPEFVFNH
jgi:hypothetical protein